MAKVYYNGIEESRLKKYAAVYYAFIETNPIQTKDRNELHRMAAVAALLKSSGKQRAKNIARKVGKFQTAAEEYIKKNGSFEHGRNAETTTVVPPDGAAPCQSPVDGPPEQGRASTSGQDA